MDENSSNDGKAKGVGITIVVVVVVLAALVGAWYWFMYKPEQEAKEKARQEQVAKEEARKEQAAKKKATYSKLIQQADSDFENESWETALSSYTKASSLFPKQKYPKDQLTLINVKLDEMAALLTQPTEGTVETVSSATERYYVVVSSSIDGDLAMDYGNKMAAEGKSVKIIEPYGNKRFYRVTLADFDTLDKATTAADSFISTYGNEIWVLKY